MNFLVESEKYGWPLTPNPRGSCERVEMLQENIQDGNGLRLGVKQFGLQQPRKRIGSDFIRTVQNIVVFCSAKVR